MIASRPGHRPEDVWRPIAWGALVLLGASLGGNAALLWRLGHNRTDPVATERLTAGTRILPLKARALTGELVRLMPSRSKGMVLYFFSTSCGWCERNWPNVLALEEAIRDRYEFVAISNSIDAAEFASERALPFTCLAGIPADALRRFHIGGTPRTMVLSQDGRVVKDWIGAYTTPTLKEIEQHFGVSLPGLAM